MLNLKDAAACRYDLVSLGECMIRLSPPGHGRIEFAPLLEVWVGGGEYNVAYACVLQAIIYLKVTAWGKSSPKDLHTLIWTDQAKKQYRQYDDDKVIPSLLTAVGLSAVEIEAGTTVQDVEDTFGAGKYFVSVKGSVEDHSLILDSGAWKEYNQTGSGSGFKAARTDKNAEVKSVYK